MCFVTVKWPNDHRLNVITDDLARWGSCGIPSTVDEVPTARAAVGGLRRNRTDVAKLRPRSPV
jgi:hypothetical protein